MGCSRCGSPTSRSHLCRNCSLEKQAEERAAEGDHCVRCGAVLEGDSELCQTCQEIDERDEDQDGDDDRGSGTPIPLPDGGAEVDDVYRDPRARFPDNVGEWIQRTIDEFEAVILETDQGTVYVTAVPDAEPWTGRRWIAESADPLTGTRTQGYATEAEVVDWFRQAVARRVAYPLPVDATPLTPPDLEDESQEAGP